MGLRPVCCTECSGTTHLDRGLEVAVLHLLQGRTQLRSRLDLLQGGEGAVIRQRKASEDGAEVGGWGTGESWGVWEHTGGGFEDRHKLWVCEACHGPETLLLLSFDVTIPVMIQTITICHTAKKTTPFFIGLGVLNPAINPEI